MPPSRQRRFWQRCRLYFRRLRMLVWLTVLLLIGALLYLNQVGLPGFAKRSLLEQLRARGVSFEFSRLRLRWYEGVVADDVRFGGVDDPLAPELTAAEAQLQVALKWTGRPQVQVDGLKLRNGRLTFPVAEPAGPARTLLFTNIQTQLRFLPQDEWTLDDLKAAFAGGRIRISGTITNASEIRQWQTVRRAAAEPGGSRDFLRLLADLQERVRFSSPPDLRLEVTGDARDLQSFSVRLRVAAPAATSPWGTCRGAMLNVRLFPAVEGQSRALVTVTAEGAQTPWASITNFALNSEVVSLAQETNLVRGRVEISARGIRTRWAKGDHAVFTAAWVHSVTNPVPLSGHGELTVSGARTRWGQAKGLRLNGVLQPPPPTSSLEQDPALGWWTNLAPYPLELALHAEKLTSPSLSVDDLTLGGYWTAPDLVMTNLDSSLYQGTVRAAAKLDVVTRRVRAELSSDIDPHRLAPTLGDSARKWLDQFEWNAPPHVQGIVELTLPAWTNAAPDWRREVQPTLQIAGRFEIRTNAAYRGVRVSSASSDLSYSNQCWRLPDLQLVRPEGRVTASHQADDRTGDFFWKVASSIDPTALAPLLKDDQLEVFDLFALTEPPRLEAEIRGRYLAPEQISCAARVSITNFTFRDEEVKSVETTLAYSNRVVRFFAPVAQLPDGRALADGVTLDLAADRVFLTNAVGKVDANVVARMIGPKVAQTIAPYQFGSPPNARVCGAIPLHGDQGADLHFELSGGPFHWWKFNVPQIVGQVRWKDKTLTITNVQMAFYQGTAGGWAAFDFSPARGADFRFSLDTTNTLLQGLMADLSTATNRLEGFFNSTVSVTKANTESTESVFGYGEIDLRDGLIWDIPLFGRFTPVLNSISPGLGNSRASAGKCSFVITNGVILSEDLEIKSPAMRLQYRGTVDLHEQVNARVEAEVLRDMWLVGPLVSTVLWPVTKMFEYKVTGTLGDPKTEAVYFVPKLINLPLHPIKTLRGLFPEEPAAPPAPGPTDGAPSSTPAPK